MAGEGGAGSGRGKGGHGRPREALAASRSLPRGAPATGRGSSHGSSPGSSHGAAGSDASGTGAGSLALVGDAATARLALSPLRRELLARLRSPGSASSLSNELNLPRQKLGYHLRVLEQAGLIAAAGTRQRRGFTEQLFETKSDALILDPMILAPADPETVEKQDRFAAAHLVRTAAGIVREVSRMREAAADEGSRLLTFTLEADIGFAAPSDIERFTGKLAEALAALAREFPAVAGRRVYQLTAAGHPAVEHAESKPKRIN